MRVGGQLGMLKNMTNKENEKVTRLAQVAADDMIDIPEVKTGDIAAVFGLKNPLLYNKILFIYIYFIKKYIYLFLIKERNTSTGDTLIAMHDNWAPQLSGILTPPPVFVCSVEPESASGYNLL